MSTVRSLLGGPVFVRFRPSVHESRVPLWWTGLVYRCGGRVSCIVGVTLRGSFVGRSSVHSGSTVCLRSFLDLTGYTNLTYHRCVLYLLPLVGRPYVFLSLTTRLRVSFNPVSELACNRYGPPETPFGRYRIHSVLIPRPRVSIPRRGPPSGPHSPLVLFLRCRSTSAPDLV